MLLNFLVYDTDVSRSVQAYKDWELEEKCFVYPLLISATKYFLGETTTYTPPASFDMNNASTVYWMMRSLGAYDLSLQYMQEVHKEYEFRMGEKHPAHEVIDELLKVPKKLEVGRPLVDLPPCILIDGNNFIERGFQIDEIESYRNEYRKDPLNRGFPLTKRDLPDWFHLAGDTADAPVPVTQDVGRRDRVQPRVAMTGGRNGGTGTVRG